MRAVCALMLVYPAETDWMDNPGLAHIDSESTDSVEKVVITFDVSDFYSSSLEQRMIN